jgi:hypothetical protein
VELAALPRDTAEDCDPSRFQPGMVVTGDELHTAQTACHQALQEGPPMDFMLAQGDRDAQNLPLASLTNPNGDQDSCIANLTVLTHFLVASIQEYVGELAQRTVAPGF